MKMHKLCPRCGSKNVDWIIPQNWSQCICKDCDYTGPIVEGNDEFAEEIREAYLESLKDDDSELTKTFTEIIFHFSDFLSKHSVYEAAPENSKVLVFNSELSFKEMVKAFINEDIYCALIYDSEKQYFVGLITISDILMLFNYIIEKTQKREITDYNTFIKDIFSSNALKEEKKNDNNSSKKNKNFDN